MKISSVARSESIFIVIVLPGIICQFLLFLFTLKDFCCCCMKGFRQQGKVKDWC